jgi:DNA polymerase-1
LFDELNLPVFKKTKTGRSTDEEILQELSATHSAIPFLLQYRQLFKLVSTYVDALPKSIQEDGRIHSTFNVEGAATGRLSSTNPNLQNIPIRGEMGGELRKAFIAPVGKVLLGADYSQIELRIMADVSGDEAMKKAFQEGLDIHAATAAKIFNIPIDQVTKPQRTVGKTMNFATLYGQGPRALSRQLGIDFATAKQYITEYFEQFPKVKAWMAKTLEFGIKNGYVETVSGRRRYMPELSSNNHFLKAAGERAAINHPIQGTSADMIKMAMVEIAKELSAVSDRPSAKNNLAESRKQKADSCKLILQVHDELMFECSPEEVEPTAKMIKQKMEDALKLSVPVKVDLKSGKSWGEMSPLNI